MYTEYGGKLWDGYKIFKKNFVCLMFMSFHKQFFYMLLHVIDVIFIMFIGMCAWPCVWDTSFQPVNFQIIPDFPCNDWLLNKNSSVRHFSYFTAVFQCTRTLQNGTMMKRRVLNHLNNFLYGNCKSLPGHLGGGHMIHKKWKKKKL